MTGGFRRNHQRCAGLLRHLFAYFGIVTGALVASIGRGHGRHFFPLLELEKRPVVTGPSLVTFSSISSFPSPWPCSCALYIRPCPFATLRILQKSFPAYPSFCSRHPASS